MWCIRLWRVIGLGQRLLMQKAGTISALSCSRRNSEARISRIERSTYFNSSMLLRIIIQLSGWDIYL